MANNLPGIIQSSPSQLASQAQSSTNVLTLDEMAKLLPLKWRGICFPCLNFKEISAKRVIEHEYMDVDGARVEITGNKARRFTCTAILSNHIFPSTSEQSTDGGWSYGNLFPTVFNQLRAACRNNTSAKLQHPIDGDVVCKVVDHDFDLDGKMRDGSRINIVWVETIDDSITIQQTITINDSLSNLSATAVSIDAELTKTQVQAISPSQLSLSQFFAKISSVIKQIVSVPTNFVNSINTVGLQTVGFVNSINSNVQNALALPFTVYQQEKKLGVSTFRQQKDYALNGPALQTYNNLIDIMFSTQTGANKNAGQVIDNQIKFTQAVIAYYEAVNSINTATIKLHLRQFLKHLQDIYKQFVAANARGYTVLTYVTPNPCTLMSLVSYTNNSLGQLMQLNPTLLKLYRIPANTEIKYYQGG